MLETREKSVLGRFVVFSLILWLAFFAGEASGASVESFMNKLLGVHDGPSVRQMKTLWNTLEHLVDRYDLSFIQNNPDLKWFNTIINFDRQIFFHWGFRTDVKSMAHGKLRNELMRVMRRNMEIEKKEMERKGSSTREVGAFFYAAERKLLQAISSQQENRRRLFENKVKSVMGIRPDQAEYIATILYNCYVMSKYKGHGVLSDKNVLEQTVKEVVNDGFRKLMSGQYNKMDNTILAERDSVLRSLEEPLKTSYSAEILQKNFLDRIQEVWPLVIDRSIPNLKSKIRFGRL